jgi:hypothetical protein
LSRSGDVAQPVAQADQVLSQPASGHFYGVEIENHAHGGDHGLSKAPKHKGGPVLIECQTAHDDCSTQLIERGARVARANTVRTRPPDPRRDVPRFSGLSGAVHSWRTGTVPVTTVRPRLRVR